MSKIKNDLMGGLSGKIGNVVASSWNGISYLRSRPAHYNDAKSSSQLNQRGRMETALAFVKVILPFAKYGYRKIPRGKSAYNLFMQSIMLNGIKGQKPYLSIDYEYALISHGKFTKAKNGNAAIHNPGIIRVSWEDNSGIGSAKKTDIAMVLAFNPTKQQAAWTIEGQKRDSCSTELFIPEHFAGDELHVFLAFSKVNRSDTSNSVYLGTVLT